MIRAIRNCPNCGAVVHDCVCDYCGTVFQVGADSFAGKECIFVAMGDNDELTVMGFKVNKIEERTMCDTFYADNYAVYVNPDFYQEVTIIGTLDPSQTTAHKLKRLKSLCDMRLSEF